MKLIVKKIKLKNYFVMFFYQNLFANVAKPLSAFRDLFKESNRQKWQNMFS